MDFLYKFGEITPYTKIPKNAKNQGILSGYFPVNCKMELVSGDIGGEFPAKQRKTPQFYVF